MIKQGQAGLEYVSQLACKKDKGRLE